LGKNEDGATRRVYNQESGASRGKGSRHYNRYIGAFGVIKPVTGLGLSTYNDISASCQEASCQVMSCQKAFRGNGKHLRMQSRGGGRQRHAAKRESEQKCTTKMTNFISEVIVVRNNQKWDRRD